MNLNFKFFIIIHFCKTVFILLRTILKYRMICKYLCHARSLIIFCMSSENKTYLVFLFWNFKDH